MNCIYRVPSCNFIQIFTWHRVCVCVHVAGDLSVVDDCLDYDRTPLRRLVVLAAADGSSDYAAVFIHVTDDDDHPLRFSTDRKEAVVAEGAPRGIIVARLPPVYDPDRACNHRLYTVSTKTKPENF